MSVNAIDHKGELCRCSSRPNPKFTCQSEQASGILHPRALGKLNYMGTVLHTVQINFHSVDVTNTDTYRLPLDY